jgi:hypothetical protein
MPVSIRHQQQRENDGGVHGCFPPLSDGSPDGSSGWRLLVGQVMRMQVVLHREDADLVHHRLFLDSVHMAVIVMRQFAGPDEADRHLQEAETHQRGTERNGAIDDPGRPFEIGRRRPLRNIDHLPADKGVEGIVKAVFPHEVGAERTDDAGEQRAGEQPENDEL